MDHNAQAFIFKLIRKQKSFIRTQNYLTGLWLRLVWPKLTGIGMMRGYSFRSIGRRILLAGIGLMMSLSGNLVVMPVQAAPDPVRRAISQSLATSAVEWSRNHLDGFMASYEDSPETSYVTAQRRVRGFGAIKAMYAARFGGRKSLGELSFSLEEVRPLGSKFALAIGRYELVRVGLGPASGIFTLVFHHTQAGWKIVSDHTSS